MRLRTIALSALAVAGFGAAAFAADAPAAPMDPPKGYKRTGQFENCLKSTDIQSSRILNRNQILFETRGKGTFLNEPEQGHCPGLSTSLTLVYEGNPGELCTTTIVHLADFGAGLSQRGTCGISRFEKLERVPKP